MMEKAPDWARDVEYAATAPTENPAERAARERTRQSRIEAGKARGKGPRVNQKTAAAATRELIKRQGTFTVTEYTRECYGRVTKKYRDRSYAQLASLAKKGVVSRVDKGVYGAPVAPEPEQGGPQIGDKYELLGHLAGAWVFRAESGDLVRLIPLTEAK